MWHGAEVWCAFISENAAGVHHFVGLSYLPSKWRLENGEKI